MTIIRYSILFLFLASPLGFAADKKASPSPSATPQDRVAFHGTIVTFQRITGTFTLKGKKAPGVYVLSDATKMMKGTAQATLDDLAAGVYVRGAARPLADGRFEALTVKIELKTAPAKVEKAAKAEKKSTPEPSATP